jgi:glutamyl-Q tRNA(Asp) synthetase
MRNQSPITQPYIGRFAPSPSGPLHFGSLVAAVASYCDAKANSGQWLVRMEDVDKPREVSGAADEILRTLTSYGFEWDGEVIYQSQRDVIYVAAFEAIQEHLYPCICTRKEIADSNHDKGIDGLIYPQTCRKTSALKHKAQEAYRVVVLDENMSFSDAIQGEITQNIGRDVGDFILKRKDGLFAYQLAVVVDDAAQGVTHIVRGADLLDSTPRQIYLQKLLGFSTPNYAHVPVVTNNAGEKLSKQTLAKAIATESASQLVFQALQFLGQSPPLEIKNASLEEVWRWAIAHWRLNHVPKNRSAHQLE